MGDSGQARVLAGRYRLGDRLGRGGMGAVWTARDELLDRDVAVKEVLPPADLPDEQRAHLRERTLREARAAARISSPAAVTVFDVIEEDGRPWIVMERLDARTLTEVIRQDGTLTPAQAADVGLRVLDALQAAHRAGVLHRDVKPANVLIDRTGRAVLTDFGIATLDGDPSLTSTGILVGSPAYMAPERLRGEVPTPASDLWSLGVTLYTAVEGRPPFEREGNLPTLTALLTDPVPDAVHAGPLQPVIAGLLEKDPAARLDGETARAGLLRAQRAASVETTQVVAGPPPVAPREDPGERTQALRVPPALAAPVGAVAPVVEPVVEPAEPAAVPVAAPLPPQRRSRWGVLLTLLLVMAAGLAMGAYGLAGRGDGDPDARPGAGTATGARTAAPTTERAPTASAPTTGSGPTGSASPGSASTGSASPGSAGQTTAGTPSTREPASPSESPEPAQSSPAEEPTSSGGAALPAGWRSYQDDDGFRVGVPAGWRVSHREGRAYFTSPDGDSFFSIDSTNRPKDDPEEDWQAQERSVSRRLPGYELVDISEVDYRDWSAADWEFRRDANGQRLHVRNRGFITEEGRQAYAIYFSVPESDWDNAQDDFEAVAASFQPAPLQ